MPRSTNTFGAIHTNIIEGFWSIYKPGVFGTRQGQRQNICRSTSRRSLTNARPTWAASKRREQPEEIGSDRIRIGLACNASARLMRRRSLPRIPNFGFSQTGSGAEAERKRLREYRTPSVSRVVWSTSATKADVVVIPVLQFRVLDGSLAGIATRKYRQLAQLVIVVLLDTPLPWVHPILDDHGWLRHDMRPSDPSLREAYCSRCLNASLSPAPQCDHLGPRTHRHRGASPFRW
jgi:hypothetical protein